MVWGKRWNFSSSATTTIRHRDGWKLEETRAFVALLPVGTDDTPSIDIRIGKVSKLNITSEVDIGQNLPGVKPPPDIS